MQLQLIIPYPNIKEVSQWGNNDQPQSLVKSLRKWGYGQININVSLSGLVLAMGSVSV